MVEQDDQPIKVRLKRLDRSAGLLKRPHKQVERLGNHLYVAIDDPEPPSDRASRLSANRTIPRAGEPGQ